MNALEQWIANSPFKGQEIELLNLLQQNGIVSDNCVHAADVADADRERAITFLLEHSA